MAMGQMFGQFARTANVLPDFPGYGPDELTMMYKTSLYIVLRL